MPSGTARLSRLRNLRNAALVLLVVLLLNMAAFHSLYNANETSSQLQQHPHQQKHSQERADPLFRTRKYMKKPGRYYPGVQGGASGRQKRRCLVLWSKIPSVSAGDAPLSNPNTRVSDAIKELLNSNYDVDLMFWEDENDGKGKKYLKDLGVSRVLGPYKNSIISRHPATDLNGYRTVFLWISPNRKLLFWLLDTVRYLKDINGAIRVVSFLDGPGVTYENLSGKLEEINLDVSHNKIMDWILRNRPSQLVGNDVYDSRNEGLRLDGFMPTAKEVLNLETSLCVLSTILVGSDAESVQMLGAIAPAKKTLLLELGNGENLFPSFKLGFEAVLEAVDNVKLRILVSGDAKRYGEALMVQNWHIVANLNSRGYEVSVEGDFEPRIEGVKYYPKNTEVDPFPTGLQYNAILRQSWPPDLSAPPLQTCYTGCRVAQILSWEFGSLPKEWVTQILRNSDEVWGLSNYNTRVLINSGISPSRVRKVPCGIDCDELGKPKQNRTEANALLRAANEPNEVVFVFSGGLVPRKGIDVLFQEWSGLFCNDDQTDATKNSPKSAKVRLVLHTTYELGYSRQEVEEMQSISRRCKNIEWKRNLWLDRNDYVRLLKESDIYVAPFRSEGFGLPIVEAMALGLRVVATSGGGTSTDDYLSEQNGYPVTASNVMCRHYPCSGGTDLCIFNPCQDGKCSCMSLVEPPTWYEVDRLEFRQKLVDALNDVTAIKLKPDLSINISPTKPARAQHETKNFCWSALAKKHSESVHAMLARIHDDEIM